MQEDTDITNDREEGQVRGLVADIGGTNGRFALVGIKPAELLEQRQYACAEFDSFADLVARYLSDCRQTAALPAVIAVAGPVQDNCCAMTSGNWLVDGKQLQKDGMFSSCLILNDFAALAYALPLLGARDVVQIGPQDPVINDAARLVVGPGTGLGAAFLTKNLSSYIVLEGEGSHMSFAPVDELEVELLSWFAKKYGRVSVERLISGPGLEDLHFALAVLEGRKTQKLRAEQIMSKGLSGEPFERATLLRFCAILGSFAGDMALAGGCWGGIYIGGGIVPRMPELLEESAFRPRLEAKGRFAQRLKQVPSWLITHKTSALLGAALRLQAL